MEKAVELILPLTGLPEERQAGCGLLEALIVSPDLESRRALAKLVGRCGLTPVEALTVEEAREKLATRPICVVFAEENLPGGVPNAITEMNAGAGLPVPLIVLSRRDDWPHYLRTLRRGASDCLLFPLKPDEVRWVVRRALYPPSCESGEVPGGFSPVYRLAGSRRGSRRAGRRVQKAIRRWISYPAATRCSVAVRRWEKGPLTGAQRGGA